MKLTTCLQPETGYTSTLHGADRDSLTCTFVVAHGAASQWQVRRQAGRHQDMDTSAVSRKCNCQVQSFTEEVFYKHETGNCEHVGEERYDKVSELHLDM